MLGTDYRSLFGWEKMVGLELFLLLLYSDLRGEKLLAAAAASAGVGLFDSASGFRWKYGTEPRKMQVFIIKNEKDKNAGQLVVISLPGCFLVVALAYR